MLYNYKELIDIYKSNYKLNQKINTGEIYKIETGIYSDNTRYSLEELLLKRYPNAFLVRQSAMYILGFLHTSPQKVHLGTKRNALRIKDSRIYQHFYSNLDKEELKTSYMSGTEHILSLKNVHTCISDNGNEIRLFNGKALLYDLIRFREYYSKEDFQEILSNFKKRYNFLDFESSDLINNLEYEKVTSYWKKSDMIYDLDLYGMEKKFQYEMNHLWDF